ncbi:MAG TPA: class I adenylate-forming enzyme family protein [Streptosporangiaceae bacterium]|jgi:acyl-coenzyme A synthetase/AMP-(fatty) acid ligase|nr:class I adenylate-forming enzyme family protein [Streptosporangiaceae bacterium]
MRYVSVKGIRAQLAANQDLGAGNVLTTLMAVGDGLDEPRLTFDTAVDGFPAWQGLTTRQLDRLVKARATTLHGLGIGMRDPVAVVAPTAADTALTFLALTRLGAIPALINPFLPTDLMAEYIRRLNATGLLTDAAHADELAAFGHGVPFLADVTALGSGEPDDAPEPYDYYPDDPVAITHSSGTTGLPKAVVHSHHSLFAAIRYRLTLPRPQGTDRILSAMPCPHAAGVIVVNLGLTFGGEVAMVSRQTGPGVLEAIERWRPHSVIGFSTTWPDLVKADLPKHDLSSVALWWNTGDTAHEAHIRRLIACGSREVVTSQGRQRVPGSVFVDGIGSSEMGHSHFFIQHSADTDRYNRCIGKPHGFAETAIFGPDGQELPPGQVGELGTKAATLSLGYWNDSARTYRTRVRGYFLTGDLVYRDEEGYYYHLDRKVDSVDLGNGNRLYTAASEERVLKALPDVLDCTVVAARDGDQVVTDVLLILEAGAGSATDRSERVRAALDPAVAATLRQVLVVDDANLPLTATGKVRKNLLRERHLEVMIP